MEYKSLDKMVKIKTGKLDANASSENGEYPFFTCANQPLKIDNYEYDCECVLVAGNGDLNVKYYKGRFNAYQRTYIIEAIDGNELNIKYLYYFMTKYIDVLRNSSIGGVIKYIKINDLTSINLPIPSIETQLKIVEILDNAQGLIDKRKEQIELLDELIQSIFYDVFGDPISNPKGWEMVTLKDITTKILSGNTPKGGSKVYVDEGIVFLRSQNVWRNNLKLDDVVYIDIDTHNKMKNTSVKNKDILITKTGRVNTENSSLGRASMFIGEDDSANVNGHVYLVRLKENYTPEFVLFILTTEVYRSYIRRVCVGGIDKRQINKEHLEEFPILNPPIELQKEFAEKVKAIEKQKELLSQSLKELENNFNSIMQRAFKGELVK